MSGIDPSSWIDKFVGACVGVLGGAIALYCAVQVIQTVMPFLVMVIGVVALVVGGITIFRWYRNHW